MDNIVLRWFSDKKVSYDYRHKVFSPVSHLNLPRPNPILILSRLERKKLRSLQRNQRNNVWKLVGVFAEFGNDYDHPLNL